MPSRSRWTSFESMMSLCISTSRSGGDIYLGLIPPFALITFLASCQPCFHPSQPKTHSLPWNGRAVEAQACIIREMLQAHPHLSWTFRYYCLGHRKYRPRSHEGVSDSRFPINRAICAYEVTFPCGTSDTAAYTAAKKAEACSLRCEGRGMAFVLW